MSLVVFAAEQIVGERTIHHGQIVGERVVSWGNGPLAHNLLMGNGPLAHNLLRIKESLPKPGAVAFTEGEDLVDRDCNRDFPNLGSRNLQSAI